MKEAMDVHFSIKANRVPTGLDGTTSFVEEDVNADSLDRLFHTLSKRHPELAPLLEDATHQDDLEIFVNEQPVRKAHESGVNIHDGDSVSLLIKTP